MTTQRVTLDEISEDDIWRGEELWRAWFAANVHPPPKPGTRRGTILPWTMVECRKCEQFFECVVGTWREKARLCRVCKPRRR